jgi:hypothetical protein
VCFKVLIFLLQLDRHIDAILFVDNQPELVFLKEVNFSEAKSSNEANIALMLNRIQDRENHSVPIIDAIVDNSIVYLVMPFLRPATSPPFEILEDALDFADQILEVSSGGKLRKSKFKR